jgi:hypothetical protein
MPLSDSNRAPRPQWEIDWKEILRKRCTQRVLVVTDGGSSFDAGSAVGLTELIRVLEGNGDVAMPVPVTVTTASIADGFSFAGATPPVTVTHYDQVWLFGFTTGAAGPIGADLHVLVSFMQAGGGVFATGDHSDIGRPLSGALPRVRKMREWSAVPMSGPTRLDTVNHPGADGQARNSDQSDAFGQTIYPVPVPVPCGSGANTAPHPLLASAHGAINVLPDHPHESECYAPRGVALEERLGPIASPGRTTIAAFDEFAPVAGFRVGPVLAAVALSASLNVDKGPVAPRCFGAISAYDGHAAGVGRVVCDATWHHFVNMNLNGAGTDGTGLYEGRPAAANAAYLQIQRYFGNIAEYLTPKNRRWCWLFDRVFTELYRYPLWEELQTLPFPPGFPPGFCLPPEPPEPWPQPVSLPWPVLVQAGELMAAALRARSGPGALDRLAQDLVDAAGLSAEWAGWAESLSSRLQCHGCAGKKAALHIHQNGSDTRELQLGAVGSLVLRLRSALPADPKRALKQAELLHDKGFKVFRSLWLQDLAAGAAHLAQQHTQALRSLKRMGKPY